MVIQRVEDGACAPAGHAENQFDAGLFEHANDGFWDWDRLVQESLDRHSSAHLSLIRTVHRLRD